MVRYFLIILFFVLPLGHCAAQRLVLPGDFPDPSVTKIGDTYWATATTSNWGPAFPLLASKDLYHWEYRGYTFTTLPAWADYYFWAPEISYDNGKVFIYYAAHKRDGNLCVGIASSEKPEGPYTDHGPIVCQEAGSIDAFPMRDENGKLYLIWKEDGNSVNKPTPIWAQEMDESRTKLVGEKTELFRNDAPWEANLVEGVSMIRHGGYYYAFYSGAGCCGRGCSYGLGVARAPALLGPWEKHARNPVLSASEDWKCPGHGTAVEMNSRYYFLYHGYSAEGDVYAGRQGLLSEFRFTPDGWVEFLTEEVAEQTNATDTRIYEENFSKDTLSMDWQWSVFNPARTNLDNGALTIAAGPGGAGAFIGHKTFTSDYEAETSIFTAHSNAEAGIALIGDEQNLICASVSGNLVRVWKLEAGKETILAEKTIRPAATVQLKVKFNGPKNVTFVCSVDDKRFSTLNPAPVDAFFLPPWDRAVRVGLLAKGKTDQHATFDRFVLRNK
jgi:xylan 1,4-beta-xylosidase